MVKGKTLFKSKYLMANLLIAPNSKTCRDPGSNRGPLDLQSNALPTELSRLVRELCSMPRQDFHSEKECSTQIQ